MKKTTEMRSVRSHIQKCLDVVEKKGSSRKTERVTGNSQDKFSSSKSVDSTREVEKVCCKCLEEESSESEGKSKKRG